MHLELSKIITRDEAVSAVDEGIADLVAVGRPGIANPDLVTRCQQDTDENEVDQPTVFGGDERGYTDYPFLQGWLSDAMVSRARLARDSGVFARVETLIACAQSNSDR